MGTPVISVRRIALAPQNVMVVAPATSKQGLAIARKPLLAPSALPGHVQHASTEERVFQENRVSLVIGVALVVQSTMARDVRTMDAPAIVLGLEIATSGLVIAPATLALMARIVPSSYQNWFL